MKKEVKIGIFTIIIILSTWGVLKFLGGSNLLSSEDTYYAKYENIEGVQRSSQILIKGVKVGVVSDIILDITNNSGVTIELSIDSKYRIPKNSEAKIVGNGLMSPMAIEIVVGASKETLQPGGTFISSREPSLMTTASSELEALKNQLTEVTTNLSTTLNTLNTLMVSNAENINGMTANMSALTYQLNEVLTQNKQDITRAVGGLADLSETLGNNATQVDSIMINLNQLTRDLNDSNFSTSLGESLSQVNTLLTKINSTEDGIAKVMVGEDIYNNLSSASNNLDALFVDMKQYPSRYVHFSVFGRDDEKLKKKAEKKEQKNR